MARGRFISNTLGESDKFAELADNNQRLLYVMLVTHADAEGRLKGNARWINGKVLTYVPMPSSDIDAALQRMHEVGLIVLYEHEGQRYIQITKFDEHNKVRRDRDGVPTHEKPSDIPPPSNYVATTESLRSNYVATTAEVEVQVQDKVQVEVQEEDRTRESSEERMQQRLAGGTSSNETHRVRATLRRINPDFAKQNEDSMTAWARWSNDDLHYLWEYSHPKNHKDGQTKRRSWIFKDLLNEERFAPPRALIVKKDPDAWMDEFGLREMLEEIDREKEAAKNAAKNAEAQ